MCDETPTLAAFSSVRPSIIETLDGVAPANNGRARVDSAYRNRFRYSGGGCTIVQLAVEHASKSSLADVARRQLFVPLSLSRTTFQQPLPPSFATNAAHGHATDGSPIPGGWRVYPELAAAGVWTTPSDYARLLLAVRASWSGTPKAVLSQSLAKDMRHAGAGNWGLGFGVRADGDDVQIQHRGSNIGFESVSALWLQRGARVVLMTNGERGGQLRRELVRAIFAEYGWTLLSDM